MQPTANQIENTLDYLGRLIGPSPSVETKASTLASICFSRACALLLVPDEDAKRKAEAEAERMGQWLLHHPNSNNLDLDPLILASHYDLLTSHRLNTQSYGELVGRIAQALRGMPANMAEQGRIRLIASLLSRNDLDCGPGHKRPGAESTLEDPSAILVMDERRMIDALDHAYADDRTCGAEASRALALVALTDLRNYRIDLACRTLRYLLAFGTDLDYVQDALDFIGLQRRAKGGYGFFDPERSAELPAEKREIEYHLPITLNCVWTMNAAARRAAKGPTAMERADHDASVGSAA